MIKNSEHHDIDKLFKKKLENLDLGAQSQLWERLKNELDKNKRSSRILAFGWFSKLVILFTILSFSTVVAYKLGFIEVRPSLEKQAEKPLILSEVSNKTAPNESEATINQENKVNLNESNLTNINSSKNGAANLPSKLNEKVYVTDNQHIMI